MTQAVEPAPDMYERQPLNLFWGSLDSIIKEIIIKGMFPKPVYTSFVALCDQHTFVSSTIVQIKRVWQHWKDQC